MQIQAFHGLQAKDYTIGLHAEGCNDMNHVKSTGASCGRACRREGCNDMTHVPEDGNKWDYTVNARTGKRHFYLVKGVYINRVTHDMHNLIGSFPTAYWAVQWMTRDTEQEPGWDREEIKIFDCAKEASFDTLFWA